MKKYVKVICILLAFALALGVALPIVLAAESALQTAHILFSHDLHAHFLPTQTYTGAGYASLGGFARTKTLIDDYRQAHPDALLVDAGDFSMGTLFQTVFDTEALELRMLGQLGYDAATLGNHEFDFRGEGLASMLRAARDSGDPLPALVLGNYSLETPEGGDQALFAELRGAFKHYGVQEYTVIERGGLKIGIFGILGENAEDCAPMADVQFTSRTENAKRISELLRTQEQADLIICLSHSGTSEKKEQSEDVLLAEAAPEIDVIVSGHTHSTLREPIVRYNTLIVSCGQYGENLGSLSLVRGEDDRWRAQEYALLPVDESVAEDPSIVQAIEQYKEVVQREYLELFGMEFDQTLASLSFNFTPATQIGKEHREEPLASLIADSYLYAVQRAEGEAYQPVAMALTASGTIRDSFAQGDITVADAFAVNSLGVGADSMAGYPLISVYLTGKELKTVCEVDASVAPIMEAAQLYLSGVRYSFNPNRLIFNKVTQVSLADGSAIEDDKLYRVVCGLYCAQMLDLVGEKSFGLMSIVPKDEQGQPVTDFEARIIHTQIDGREVELKEWYALADYLASFGEVPAAYSQPDGRKTVIDNASLGAILANPNGIALAAAGIVLAVLALLVFIVVRICTRKKRRAKKLARRAGQ